MSKLGELLPRPALPQIKIGDVVDVVARNPHDYREFCALLVRTMMADRQPSMVGSPLQIRSKPERILQLARSYEGLTLTIRDPNR